MGTKKLTAGLAFFLALMIMTLFPSTSVSAVSKMVDQNKITKTADAYLTKLYNFKKFNGTVLMIKDDKVLFSKSYGMADMELNVPITADTKFAVGSITKQFTAAAVLQLQEKGKLSIDDKLSKYIADYPNGSNITVKMLLNHTSGIADYGTDYFNESIKHYTPLELIGLFKDKPVYFQPGKQFSYINADYILLGYIIEKVSGMSYEDYVTKNIIEKAGLENTCFKTDNRLIKNIASGYSAGGLDTINAAYIDMSYPYAAGELYSTASDLSKWTDALMSGRVISKDSWESMSTAQVDTGWTPGLSYGYGLMIFDKKIGDITKKSICHGGTINGFTSDDYYIPEDNFKLIVLSNIEYAYASTADDLLSICYGQKYSEAPAPSSIIGIDKRELDAYVGEYSDGNPVNGMTVTLKDGMLYINLNAPYKYPIAMYPTKDSMESSTFVNDLISHEFKFYKDKDGSILKMDEIVNGIVMDTQVKQK